MVRDQITRDCGCDSSTFNGERIDIAAVVETVSS